MVVAITVVVMLALALGSLWSADADEGVVMVTEVLVLVLGSLVGGIRWWWSTHDGGGNSGRLVVVMLGVQWSMCSGGLHHCR